MTSCFLTVLQPRPLNTINVRKKLKISINPVESVLILPTEKSNECVINSPFSKRSIQSRTQRPQALWPAVGRQERLWGTGILLPQDFCGKTMEAATELIQSIQSKNLNFFESWGYPLTKKPEDSGYEIDDRSKICVVVRR